MEPSSKKETAFRYVIDARRIVARQRERVERLARKGSDTTEANRMLDLFTRTLNILENDLRKILEQDRNSKPSSVIAEPRSVGREGRPLSETCREPGADGQR